MEATLVGQPQSGRRSDQETELSALVFDLRNELAELRDEVASLRQQVGYWKSMHARAVEKNRKLEKNRKREERQREIEEIAATTSSTDVDPDLLGLA